jgi:L-fuconolactonase
MRREAIMMRLDAHQHYWAIERGDYGWITPELPVLYRDYLPEHLAPHLQRHKLDGSIVVQAAPTLAETEFLLELAKDEPSIKGVVAWLDLADPKYHEHYARFERHPKLVGFRVMIQEMADATRILEPDFVKALAYFADKGTPVDLLLTSQQLAPVVKLLELVPGLHAVIDHIAKPPIASGSLEPWRTQLAEIAAHRNIYCKLSGMVTEAEHKTWKPEQFTAFIRHTLAVFGPQRVMFGSDWPVCLLAASYDDVMAVLEQALPEEWTEEDRERLFGLNAKEFYRL